MEKEFQKAQEFLNSFLNLERKSFYPYKESLKLKRVYKIAKYLKIPYQDLRTIHVAGTKGKGSVSAFLAYCLASLGYRVGLFSSPHFFNFRERIKIIEYRRRGFKEKIISRQDAAEIINCFKNKLEFLKGEKPTYFELITFLGLRYFLDQNLNYTVVETGLGGRLDSTNIIKPDLSLITHIGYDHMHLLGNSLAEIAYEKAGIIKEKIPVISSCQRKLAAGVIRRTAKHNKSLLHVLGEDFKNMNIRLKRKCTLFDFQFGKHKIKNIKIRPKGVYQAENASLALAAVFAGIDRRGKNIPKLKLALENCFLPGRFELVSRQPLIIIDVAHNKSSAQAVSDNLRRYFPRKKVILVFSCSTDKKPNQMVSLIGYHKLILTQFNHPRSYDIFALKRVLRRKAISTANVYDALKQAEYFYDSQFLILVCGSFFLAAEAKSILKKQRKEEYASV